MFDRMMRIFTADGFDYGGKEHRSAQPAAEMLEDCIPVSPFVPIRLGAVSWTTQMIPKNQQNEGNPLGQFSEYN
jgi:hypothetical protein